MSKLAAIIGETEEVCASALRSAALAPVAQKLAQTGIDPTALVRRLTASQNLEPELRRLATKTGTEGDIPSAALQRALLLNAALASLRKLEGFPVEYSVKRLICEEFRFFASPAEREMKLFVPGQYSLLALAKIAILERFPAGQFHWEVSGFPRSWLFKVPPSELPRVAYFLGIQLKGFSPCFFPHMATRRKNPLMLLEKESDKSWYRMASSVQLFPGIRGLVASSWLHSPDTYKVSPHLSFINKPFVESGGVVTTMGHADESAGYMVGSAQRLQKLKVGDFRPTLGLVLWSRKQMAEWVRQHPELEDREDAAVLSNSFQVRSRT